MTKTYTAQEMREAANVVDDVSINDNGEYYYEKYDKFNPDIVRDMLRQAADAMEREKNKEKNYEYALRDKEGSVFRYHLSKPCWARRIKTGDETIVRREVGGWEEVKDGE